MSSGHDLVPTWDGDASTFEAFATHCKWFQRSLKDSEQKLAASKVWQKLTGVAKQVVKHLPPEDYEDSEGLSRLLEVLRASPLQALPVPDSLSRLEAWHPLKRHPKESIPELLVREEDLFVSLQQALERSRAAKTGSRIETGIASSSGVAATLGDNIGSSGVNVGAFGAATFFHPRGTTVEGSSRVVDPPTTPSRSPVAGANRRPVAREPAVLSDVAPMASFFEDELRGYRLLKAARLTTSERQNVLTQTGNSTHYFGIRLALRTLFSDEAENTATAGADRRRMAWWLDEEWPQEHQDDVFGDIDWQEWSPSSWDDWNEPTFWNDWSDDWSWHEVDWQDGWIDDEEINPEQNSEVPEERQLQEAFAIADEAHRTLHEAREAVKKVRAARGYYSPENVAGKGMSKSSTMLDKGRSKGKGSKDGGKPKFGPCFICGKPTHGYQNCPDRFAGKSKSKGKGFKSSGKGKSKFGGKGKGKPTFFSEPAMFNVNWDAQTLHGRPATKAVIDTGATKNAVGIDALNDLVVSGGFSYLVTNDSLPTFRFGNGQTDKAVSKVSLQGTSLGPMSFYVLDGTGYNNGMFVFRPHGELAQVEEEAKAVQLEALSSGHLTIDLAANPVHVSEARDLWTMTSTRGAKEESSPCAAAVHAFSTSTPTAPSVEHVLMQSVFEPSAKSESSFRSSHQSKQSVQERLQLLAQRLNELHHRVPARHVRESSSGM